MPEGSYPFPMYSGLFEPKHYKKIASAIWLFAWCISSRTKEVEEDGTIWGIVLGNKPMKLSEIGEQFGVNDKTVSRWLGDLQDHDYIQVTRAPRGLIIKVKNSKKDLLKRSDKNVRSQESDKTKMSDHISDDQTKMSDHEPISSSDQTKMSDAKDIKDLITTTTIILENEFSEEINPNPELDGMIAILNAYCELHKKIDTNVSALERQAMNQMVAGGMPVPFTIKTMEKMYKAKQNRDKDNFYQPNSFAYYVSGIEEAWRNTNAVKTTQPKKTTPRNGKQDKLADLRRRAEEAKQLEESRSH
ncbi:hypothetical protein [Paenibacillus sp. FSL H3-0310]